MAGFRWNSLQVRLIVLGTLSVMIALLTACAGFMWTDWRSLHEAKGRQLQAQAEIVGFNSAAVLLINDPQAGEQLLSPLSAQPTIDAAALYSEDGRLLAEYTARGVQRVPPRAPSAVGHAASATGELEYVHNVVEGGQRVGKLYLRANMQDLWRQAWEHVLVSLIVVAASLATALPLAYALARAISRPILDLAQTAHRITKHGDFAVRVENKANNEIGTLYRAFNEMLQHVDASDRALKASQDDLENRVAQRTAELREEIHQREGVQRDLIVAKEAAEGASRAKSEFLANMSHEIRTPMNGVLGLTELVLDTDLSRDQRESMEMVKTSAEGLMTVINDILDFSKIEAGKLELDPIEFPLYDLIEDTLKTLGLRAHRKGLELVCEIHPAVPERVVGDPGRLRQVLINLVGNAIKFTERGEVVVRADLVTQQPEAYQIRFSVTDTGIGIPSDKQRVIFDAFSQADGSMTRKYGGTGLGLTISSQLVSLMEGHLQVESTVGEGSTFHFQTRLGKPACLDASSDRRRPPADLTGLRVLVVDDNATNRRVLDGLLRQWGALPTGVDSGQAALAELRRVTGASQPYDLLLIDAMMPEMDGFMLMEQIHQLANLDRSVVMMLSSADGLGDGGRCRELGIAAYLVKPVKSVELRTSIIAALDRQVSKSAVLRSLTPQADEAPGGSAAPAAGLQILLAEDNPVNQRVAVRILTKYGHTVTVANNGQEALDVLACKPFDIVLMDVQMPQLDGFEATRAIRAEEMASGRHLPIIAMTAHAMKGDRERCLEAGMDDYVTKPFYTQQLLAVIDRTVQASQRRSAVLGRAAATSLPLEVNDGSVHGENGRSGNSGAQTAADSRSQP